MADFLIRGTLAELDPELAHLAELEAERQFRKLILIPSESSAPQAVLEALGTAFHNIYAEATLMTNGAGWSRPICLIWVRG